MLPRIKRGTPKGFWAYYITYPFLLWLGLLWLFDVDLTNVILHVCAALLFGFMLCLFILELLTHKDALRPGCLLIFALTLLSGLLGLAGYAGHLLELPWEPLSSLAFFLFSLVLLVGIPCNWLATFEGYYHQAYLARKLYRDLGFVHATNRIPGGDKELFISHLQPEGVFAQAGFQAGDVVLDKNSFTGFFMKLERARGGPPIAITVARSKSAVAYLDPTPLPERPVLELSVRVPPRDIIERLEKELGFRCALDFFKRADLWVGVLVVQDVQQGGVFQQAGFQERDILLDVGGAPHFFETLEQARGQEIDLAVVPWIDPPDVANRSRRELTLQVPLNNLPSDEADTLRPLLRLSRRRPDWVIERELQRDLGFREGWEWLPHNGEWHGTPTVENLQPSGVLAQAGFQERDIILEGFSYGRRWEKARGGEPITVRVASWVEPPPLHQRPRRVLTIRVPPKSQ